MQDRHLIFRDHALRRMLERGIAKEEVVAALRGELIESYPEDFPYASRLMMGFLNKRPLHVVAADIPDTDKTIIITVYEPDPQRWDASFRMRRMP